MWFKILMVTGAVTAWAQKALEDGKIDLEEAAELVRVICSALGVDAIINLPTK